MLSRPRLSFRPLVAVVAGVALLASASAARADTISIGDSQLPGLFTGSVTVSDQTSTSAVITVSLTNISPSSNGGYITGFAFNDPNVNSKGNINGVSSFSTTYDPNTGQNFQLIGGSSFSDSIATSPYGFFDIGAAVGGSWLGGGGPVTGLAVGETGTFTFVVSGKGLTNLTAENLLAAMSTNGTAGFAVRFRGFTNGDSDKDLAGVVTSPPPPPPPPSNAIPTPPGVVLAGMGFGCLLLGRLRFRRPTAK